MKLKIDVKQENIDKGDPVSPEYCPIALAMHDLGMDLGYRFWALHVDGDEVYFTYRGEKYRLDLPPAARDFVESFDAEEHVEPFSFELELKKYEIDRSTFFEVSK